MRSSLTSVGAGHGHGHAAGRAADRGRLRLVLAITAVVLGRAIDCAVTFGVFSLVNRTVGVSGPTGWQAGLYEPPDGDRSLTELLSWGAANAGL